MTFQERLNALREKFKAKVNADLPAEELAEINATLGDLDEIEKEYNNLSEVSAKYKDTIVNLTLNQGNDRTPPDDSQGSKPKSMEEFIKDFEKEHKED